MNSLLRCPRILALFEKRIEGDDALLQLARLRFREAGLGAEFYAETPATADWLLKFMPSPETPTIIHLSRTADLFDRGSRELIIEFAQRYKDRIFGMVVHDQAEIAGRLKEYLSILRDLAPRLEEIRGAPLLFIEYASGLEPDTYINLFREIRGLGRISACLDIGHMGLRQAATEFSRIRPGEDIFAFAPDDPRLPGIIKDIQGSLRSAVEAVSHMVREISGLGKPLHFHLHDAHPLWKGPFGISDHLGFLDKIRLPFKYEGRRHLDTMFGPSGLSRIVGDSLALEDPDLLSFTLEIHPRDGRLPLGNASYIFSHWTDKGNAERMNFWLSSLCENKRLLLKSCGKEEKVIRGERLMIIYNLFPLLAGKFSEWEDHLLRASRMGFNWVFVNPVQLPGSSGSIYSIKDYFSFNPLLLDAESPKPPAAQAKEAIEAAERLGLRMMVDLVINHCSVDSALLKSHPEWFQWEGGRVANPYANENGRKVVWKDLAKFDHRNTRDKEGLFSFFLEVIKFLAELGFKGFRCDAAYQVPGGLWERLIKEARKLYPDLFFLAETLGTTPDLTRKTASAGFDYIFNSSKWWDFESQWLIQQYALTREIAPSISFPESHDTVRLCEELNGNIDGLKQRYLFSALFSAGVMMPIGFEFGFRKRLHVVKTRPEDWEETGIDLTSFIAEVNRIKSGHLIFQEDAPTEFPSPDNPKALVVWKASAGSPEESLLIFNKDIYNKQRFYAGSLQRYLQAGAPLIDTSPECRMDYIPSPFSYDLMPGEGKVLITSRDSVPED